MNFLAGDKHVLAYRRVIAVLPGYGKPHPHLCVISLTINRYTTKLSLFFTFIYVARLLYHYHSCHQWSCLLKPSQRSQYTGNLLY